MEHLNPIKLHPMYDCLQNCPSYFENCPARRFDRQTASQLIAWHAIALSRGGVMCLPLLSGMSFPLYEPVAWLYLKSCSSLCCPWDVIFHCDSTKLTSAWWAAQCYCLFGGTCGRARQWKQTSKACACWKSELCWNMIGGIEGVQVQNDMRSFDTVQNDQKLQFIRVNLHSFEFWDGMLVC